MHPGKSEVKVQALRRFEVSPALRLVIGIPTFAALTALAAHARLPLPFTPVPVTMQVFTVLLAGGMLGGFGGAASMALYLALGVLGLPLFAGPAGLAVLSGATGGYILAFPAAAALVGLLTERYSGFAKTSLASFAGVGLIYLGGTLWMGCVLGVGIGKALQLGAFPFIGVDLLKALAAAGLGCWYKKSI